MESDDRDKAEALYRKLLAIFPEMRTGRDAPNVIRFPVRNLRTPAAKAPVAAGDSTAVATDGVREKDSTGAIEKMLRQLFDEIATDD